MAITECGKGHLYDSDQYPSCPYCKNGGNVINFGPESTDDLQIAHNISKTAAVSGGFGPGSSSFSSGQLFHSGNNNVPPMEEPGGTVAPEGYRRKKEKENKTESYFKHKINLEPVVGWLVCIDGPSKGKDYRIWAKNNCIGRSEDMDISISGDNTISRENHARLSYDPRHNKFHLIPAQNTNHIYLNDEPVYIPTLLAPYDLIELGSSKMVFVPFCCSRFTWEKGLSPNNMSEESKE